MKQFSSFIANPSRVQLFKDAMQYITDKTMVNGKTCVQFKPRTSQTAYIRFVEGDGWLFLWASVDNLTLHFVFAWCLSDVMTEMNSYKVSTSETTVDNLYKKVKLDVSSGAILTLGTRGGKRTWPYPTAAIPRVESCTSFCIPWVSGTSRVDTTEITMSGYTWTMFSQVKDPKN